MILFRYYYSACRRKRRLKCDLLKATQHVGARAAIWNRGWPGPRVQASSILTGSLLMSPSRINAGLLTVLSLGWLLCVSRCGIS